MGNGHDAYFIRINVLFGTWTSLFLNLDWKIFDKNVCLGGLDCQDQMRSRPRF